MNASWLLCWHCRFNTTSWKLTCWSLCSTVQNSTYGCITDLVLLEIALTKFCYWHVIDLWGPFFGEVRKGRPTDPLSSHQSLQSHLASNGVQCLWIYVTFLKAIPTITNSWPHSHVDGWLRCDIIFQLASQRPGFHTNQYEWSNWAPMTLVIRVTVHLFEQSRLQVVLNLRHLTL